MSKLTAAEAKSKTLTEGNEVSPSDATELRQSATAVQYPEAKARELHESQAVLRAVPRSIRQVVRVFLRWMNSESARC